MTENIGAAVFGQNNRLKDAVTEKAGAGRFLYGKLLFLAKKAYLPGLFYLRYGVLPHCCIRLTFFPAPGRLLPG